MERVACVSPTRLTLTDQSAFHAGIQIHKNAVNVFIWIILSAMVIQARWIKLKDQVQTTCVQKVYLELATTIVEWCIKEEDQTVFWKQPYCD